MKVGLGKNILKLGQKYLKIGARISYNWGRNNLQFWLEYLTIKAQLFYGESKDALQLEHKTMEAKNIFNCSKKKKE